MQKKNKQQQTNEPSYTELKSQLWLAKMQLKDLKEDYDFFKKMQDEMRDMFKPLLKSKPLQTAPQSPLKAESERILKPAGMDAQCARCRLFNECAIRRCSIDLKIKHCLIHSEIRLLKETEGDIEAYLNSVLWPEETPASGVKIDIERPFLN